MSDDDDKDDTSAAQLASSAAEAPASARAQPGALLTPALARKARLVVPIVWLVAVFVAGYVSGVELAFLVLAGGVLVLVITLMWSSVQSLTGSSSLGFEEALGMGAPSKAEEEKRAVLRALKDLEYERGVGKISPEDYAELSTKYRAEAKRLIQAVDESLAPARDEVERVLQKRLDRAGLAKSEPQPEPEPQPAPAAEEAEAKS